MIQDLSSNPIIQTLQESSLIFYLTGSRFFGNEGKQSDWDFVVENIAFGGAIDIVDTLKEMGFEKIDKYTDGDINNSLVCCVYQQQDVDVIIVNNLKRYLNIRDKLALFRHRFNCLGKAERAFVWNLLLS